MKTLLFRSRRCRIIALPALLLGLLAKASGAEQTDAIDDTVADFFRPYLHDLAALSPPDGRRIAMSEHGGEKPPVIVIVNPDDRTSQRHVIASRAEHAALQLQWISPKRLVFTTRSRSVGLLDVENGKLKVLLHSQDIDAFKPEPRLGPRSRNVTVASDMSADPSRTGISELGRRREITLREALEEARVTGDLFNSDSKRAGGPALHPFLLGLKPGAPDTVLVELRGDGDLFVYRRGEQQKITVPGNVIVTERGQSPSESESGPGDLRAGGYAAYNIAFPAPPLVVLELETRKGRTKSVTWENNWRRIWLDHQGVVRIALELQGKRFRYLYREGSDKKWVPLDSVAKTPLGFTVGADTLFAPRSVPLGFDADGRTLFIATNVGSDTFTFRALDLTTGQLEEFEIGHEQYDLIEPTALTAGEVLRFDPHTRKLLGVRFAAARRDTRWLDPTMLELQTQLNQQLAPGRCEIREWNVDRTRFLVDLGGPGNPGGLALVDASSGKIIRCGERAPWLTEQKRNVTEEFDFLTDDGRRLAGYLTLPKNPRLNPPPVLVYFHDGPWFSDPPIFNRGAQALAGLGFAVLQLNHRGSSGFGRSHLKPAEGLDREVLKDIQAMLTRAAGGKLGINTRMAAALGNGVGGYLAVRMAQLAPETFRCAVAINAPGDLDAWISHPDITPTLLTDMRRYVFGEDRAALRAQSAVTAGPATTAPVLVVHGTENNYVPFSLGRDLYRALKDGSAETTLLELPNAGHGGWSEKTTAKLFAELGRFFNATIYSYDVKASAPKVVP